MPLDILQWIYRRSTETPLLAVSDRHAPTVHVFNADKPEAPPVSSVSIHTAPVLVLAYSAALDLVISGDSKGVLEYWGSDPERQVGPMFRLQRNLPTSHSSSC
jgi:hypothetical protein